jgi:hypothetical protein
MVVVMPAYNAEGTLAGSFGVVTRNILILQIVKPKNSPDSGFKGTILTSKKAFEDWRRF